jgi:hypothetical protein
MNTFKLGRRVLVSVGALVLAAGFAFGPAAAAFADNGTPPAPTPGQGDKAGGRIDERLRKAYQRQQEMLELQAQNLSRADEAAGRAQSFIDAVKARGEDTSALETALVSYKTQLAAAQSAHDTAADILGAHAGFGDNDQVTDREQARQTLQSAREALQQARTALFEAGRTLREAMRAWREAHPRPAPQDGGTTSDKGA